MPYWRYRLLLLLVMSGLLVSVYQLVINNTVLPDHEYFHPLIFSGQVVGLPQITPHDQRFLLRIKRGLLRLNWYAPYPSLMPGQRWQLHVKLKPFLEPQNPGQHISSAHDRIQGVVATGYVIQSLDNHLLAHGQGVQWLNRYRFVLAQDLYQLSQHEAFSGVFAALSLGDKSRVSADQWQVFQSTGTGHLLAISGLHVGFCAAMGFFFIRWLWVVLPWLSRRFSAQAAGWVGAVIIAFIYSALAGFAIPTQRACLMLVLLALSRLYKQQINSFAVLLLVAVVIVCLEPLSFLDIGFYLSFSAVLVLLFGMAMSAAHRLPCWRRWFFPHWVIAVGFMPMSALFFGTISTTSLIANCLAIPWVSFLVVPLVLLALICLGFAPGLSAQLLTWANTLMQWLWVPMSYLAHWRFNLLPLVSVTVWHLLLAIIASAILLLPKALPAKKIALILYLPLLFPHTDSPADNSARVTILAVGQGLSVFVQTAHHQLLYDTGPASTSGYSAAKAVVLPFLKTQGVRQLSRLVISHRDNDHAGGVPDILSSVNVMRIDSSAPSRFFHHRSLNCHQVKPWCWDGVCFRYLSVNQRLMSNENDRSCVLRIAVGQQAILLPGDISKRIEQRLVKKYPQQRRASILVAAHHGSQSASSAKWIDAVSPRYVIFATGFANHFFFPNLDVIQRYHDRHIHLLDTGAGGAVRCLLSSNQASCYYLMVAGGADARHDRHFDAS